MANEEDLESLFYLTEGWILVGLTKDLEEQFRDAVSKLGYEVPKLSIDTLIRMSPHSVYWTLLKGDLDHYKGIGILLQVKVEPGQENEAITQLLPHIIFAERMYGMHEPEEV